MAKRPSDTAAIASRPPKGETTESYSSQSTTIRKIENGFVVCESTCKDGDYKSREYFCEEKPSIAPAPAGGSGGESLRDAVKSIRG